MDVLNLILGIVATAVTAVSLTYGVKTNRERGRIENLVKAKLASIAGSIELIRKNPHWADKHFKAISESAHEVNQDKLRKDIAEHAQAGARDVTAAERMLRILRNDVLALQKGMFGTEDLDKFDIPSESPTYGNEPAAGGDAG